ncbi:peptide-methionine (R)-S-oxide reductase MsrB [Natronogracilivirga saccharolytica]|nr:peptide-methionine (R)-S-oxide reductase MsrB [Natronogracilivirga saccharolytica]
MTVDINRPLPDKLRNQMLPHWFDPGLFPSQNEPVNLSDSEWKERLTPAEYEVLRSHGTEPPFKNEYFHNEEEGVYLCRGCSNPLFSSAAKFRSSSGWPSFFAPVSQERIGTESDHRLLMERTEVHCARCGGHLGHVFEDGPEPTGLRYCLNSPSLRFIDEEAHRKIAGGREHELDFELHK